MWKQLANKKGMGLVWIYLTTIVLGLVSAGLYGMSFWHNRLVAIDIARERAFYLAEGGVNQKLYELRNLLVNNTLNIPTTNFGSGSYAVTYDSNTLIMTATGTSQGVRRIVEVQVAKASSFNPNGAISGNENMTTTGNIVVDGNDHSINGTVVGDGIFGVSTSDEFSLSGSSEVGGNGFPTAPEVIPGTVEEGADPLPTTPEEILGLPVGALDQYKTTTLPTLPMQGGIVYLTSNDGSNIWLAPMFGTAQNPSSGILIFHNSNVDAKLKNLNGYFNGIIITDQLDHVNNTAVINGAIVIMEANSIVGNGTAHVNYSQEAIDNVFSNIYTIVAWKELP